MTTTIDFQWVSVADYSQTPLYYSCKIQPANKDYQSIPNSVLGSSFTIGALDVGNFVFPDTATAQTYFFTNYMAGLLTALGLVLGTCIQGRTLTVDSLTQTLVDALDTRTASLESWMENIKIDKAEGFEVTTNSTGDVSITTSTAFTTPKIIATPKASAGTEGYHCVVTGVSGTTITARVFHNKTQSVLIGGTIDPDSAVASTVLDLLVIQTR